MANQNQIRQYVAPPRYTAQGYRSSDGRKKIMGVRSAGDKFGDLAGQMEEAGVKIKGGQMTPTQDYGSMAGMASEQRNSLSRGSRAGSGSTLGQPMNSMYASSPGFFQRRGISQAAPPAPTAPTAADIGAQRESLGTSASTNVPSPTGSFDSMFIEKRGFPGGKTTPTFGAQALPDDTPGAASAAARGMAFKGATRGASSGASAAPAMSPMETNRQALEQGAAGIRLRREALGQAPTVRATSATGAPMASAMGAPTLGESRTIEGKYGGGRATFNAPTGPRPEGMIGGRPSSEVFQGLANKSGEANKFAAPQKALTPDDIKKQRTSLARR